MRLTKIRFASRKWCLVLLGVTSGIPWPKFKMSAEEAEFWAAEPVPTESKWEAYKRGLRGES